MARLTSWMYRGVEGVWKVLPAKRILAHALRPLRIVRRKLYSAFRFKGRFRVRTARGSFMLYNHGHGTLDAKLFWHGWDGQRERESARLWVELARNANLIFDVGSNTGIYALSAAAANPSGRIHAFEPSLRVFEKLSFNIRLNRFDNVTAWPLALSDETGQRTFYDVVGEHQHSASLEKEMVEATFHRPVSVETIRLDEFMSREGLNSLDLIKIDVEMHEPAVLKGMGDAIQRHKPAFLIEVLTDSIGSQITERLLPHGYLFFDIDEQGPPVLRPTVLKSTNLNYLACQPLHAAMLKLDTHAV